jgi:hypothetical protein
MTSEQPARTFFAPPGMKITSIGDLLTTLLDLSNQGDPVAKELTANWRSLKNQAQTIVNQLYVRE